MLDQVLSRLDLVRRSPHGFMARCPCHQDKTPSLSVREIEGRVACRCFGCGAGTRDVYRALNLPWDGRADPPLPFDLALMIAKSQGGQVHRWLYAEADAEREYRRKIAELAAELHRVIAVVRKDVTGAGEPDDEAWELLDDAAAIERHAWAMTA